MTAETVDAETILRRVLLGEVEARAGHYTHGWCNCERTVNCVVQRLRSDLRPVVRAWLDETEATS